MKAQMSFLILLISFASITLANEEIHQNRNWEKLEVPGRALWVWNTVSTRYGLPQVKGQQPRKKQFAANKQAKKTWDGKRSADRFRENYKGAQNLFFDFCKSKSIDEIYMFGTTWEWSQKYLKNHILENEDFWRSFNLKANKLGIKVWLMFYLWDNPDDPRMNKSTDSIKYIVETVIRFNQKYPKSAFVGIHGDQEPKNKKSYTDLLENMQKAQAVVNNNLNSTILISQALRPAWIRESITWKGTSKTMNEHILDTINHAALMCYHQNIKVINKWSDSVIKIATEKQKKVSIGFEVNNLYNAWPSANLETWWEKITKEPATTRFKVNQKDQILTFEEAMRDTQKRLSSEKSFDKMVIHSYSGYFEHWFGQATRDYILSLPTKSYEK